MLGREHVFGHPALTDEVTGLANRLHFELVYSYLFEGADRGVPLTVMLVEIPELEKQELAAVGEVIQRVTRTSDLVAHLQHGRFAVLLLGTNINGGRIAADRLEEALEGMLGDAVVAIALAGYQPHMKEPHELLQVADTQLRRARGKGGGLEMA